MRALPHYVVTSTESRPRTLREGKTPLATAAKFGNDDVAEVLLKGGARVEAVDSREAIE